MGNHSVHPARGVTEREDKRMARLPRAFRALEAAEMKRAPHVTEIRFVNLRNARARGKTLKGSILLVALTAAAALAVAGASMAAEPLAVPQTVTSESERVLGSPNAPVTMVEFSDFQCSFCRKFWALTLPSLKETYIKTGQLRLVYQHFAILGEHSVAAAQAAECAREQGKFWPYHDKLFESQGALAFTEAKLGRYAEEMALDVGAFTHCLASRKYRRKVEDETTLGFRLGARGTPTFFINGRLFAGAQPFEAFRAAIEEALARTSSGRSDKEGRSGKE